ncbi:MAG: TraR/DksA C4-type zinc finger protein [Bacillota bacterium]
MDQAQLNQFKKRLLEEKARIEEELGKSEQFQVNQSISESIGELSTYDNHPADIASETFEREKDLALRNNAREILARINEALENIDKGDYGKCESCGREINPERLEAIPYTTFCLDCQRVEDDRYITRERPVEEDVLEPPFGRTFKDNTDYVGTDGEDVWQKVARYGTSDTPSDVPGADSYEDAFWDAEEDQGIVEKIDGIINYEPDETPPDPANPDQRN